jgi:hypothetical protein
MSGAGRLLNQLASVLLALSGLVGLMVAVVFVVDPFGAARRAQLASNPTPTITLTPSVTRPPTWTPTATPGPSDTPGPTPTPSITPTPSPTRPPVATFTHTPSPTPPGPTFSPFKFTQTNEEIQFIRDPYGAQCGTWMGVSGHVLGVDGSPLPGVTVVGWGGPIPEQEKRPFISGSSSNINVTYNSPAAYEIYIGAPGEFDFYIQVYENGQPVSEAIHLRTRADCRANLAVVNLQRNH